MQRPLLSKELNRTPDKTLGNDGIENLSELIFNSVKEAEQFVLKFQSKISKIRQCQHSLFKPSIISVISEITEIKGRAIKWKLSVR